MKVQGLLHTTFSLVHQKLAGPPTSRRCSLASLRLRWLNATSELQTPVPVNGNSSSSSTTTSGNASSSTTTSPTINNPAAMSIVSQFLQISSKFVPLIPQLTSNPRLLAPNWVRIKPSSWKSMELGAKREIAVRAVTDDDEWGPDPVGGSAVTATDEAPAEKREIEDLKRQLVDSFNGTDRGLRANSERRAEIVELITQLGAKNPPPAPTEALSLLLSILTLFSAIQSWTLTKITS